MKDKKLICNKGFIFTTDSFIGITLLALLMLASLSYSSQIEFNSWNFIDLISSTRDLGVVLEKDDVLKNSVLLESSELLLGNLNVTPNNLCFEVSIFEEDDSFVPIINVIKAGCVKDFSKLVVVNKSLVVRNDSVISFYVIKIEGWVNE